MIFLRGVPKSTSNPELKRLKAFSDVEKKPHLLSKVSGLLSKDRLIVVLSSILNERKVV